MTVYHVQTWNLSKILHRRIFRLKILHRQFYLISTVLVRKKHKKCVKMEKFTPMAKILQFCRQWRQGQISPLAQGTQGLSFESVSHWQSKTMIGLRSDKKDFRTVKCPRTILTNQTSFVSLNPLVHERHWDKGGLVRKRLDGGAKSPFYNQWSLFFRRWRRAAAKEM